jgi:predicted metal-dependent phosphoesterase TrpH
MFRADLHCHTTCSDGTVTPVELVALAKKIGLAGLSITDHDTIDAYETAIPAAHAEGLVLGTGVEFSCAFQSTSVHILGYDYQLDNQEIRSFCKRHQQRRHDRNREILQKLERVHMPLDPNLLEKLGSGGRTIGRPHIAQLMVDKGYVGTIKEAFNLYLADDKGCYVPGVTFSVAETIDVIQQAGGKAFLAHPHLLGDGKMLKELLKLHFDGIECHYARCAPEKERRWLKIAKEKNWLISGGSDFHGAVKTVPLGCSWVDEETFHKIFQHPL